MFHTAEDMEEVKKTAVGYPGADHSYKEHNDYSFSFVLSENTVSTETMMLLIVILLTVIAVICLAGYS